MPSKRQIYSRMAVLLLSICTTAHGQRTSPVRGDTQSLTELKTTSENTLHIPAFGAVGFPLCDGEGNAFFAVVNDGNAVTTILRISADASETTPMRLPEDLAKARGTWVAAVNPAGTVYALSVDKASATLVRFAHDGEPDQRTTLHMPGQVSVLKLIVFADGHSSVLGTQTVAGADNKPRRLLYRGLFAADGTALPTKETSPEEVGVEHMLDATLGMDAFDNAYFVRRGKVVSFRSNGEVSKTLTLSEIPEGGTPDGAQIIGGKIAISYSKHLGNSPAIFNEWNLVDLDNGQVLGRYAPGSDFRGSRLCYLGKAGFSYITRVKGNTSIVRMSLP